MLKIVNNNIQLTRGDTCYLTINIIDEDTNEPYNLADTETLTFSVAYVPGKPNIIQKQITDNIIWIEPEDTKNLPFRKFVYDVQLTADDGSIYTIIPPSIFEVCEEVTL